MPVDYEIEDREDFYNRLPDEITIGIKISKDVYIRMLELETKEQGSGLMCAERRACWGWFLETIRHFQRGVRYFYEDGAKKGPPSIRFLDDDGNDIDPHIIQVRPYQ